MTKGIQVKNPVEYTTKASFPKLLEEIAKPVRVFFETLSGQLLSDTQKKHSLAKQKLTSLQISLDTSFDVLTAFHSGETQHANVQDRHINSISYILEKELNSAFKQVKIQENALSLAEDKTKEARSFFAISILTSLVATVAIATYLSNN